VNIGELIEELSQYPKDWNVEIGYEGTSNSLRFVSAYPEGYKKLISARHVDYHIQCFIDQGKEPPTAAAAREYLESLYVVQPQTVIVGTY
jgi:hypothetical protein